MALSEAIRDRVWHNPLFWNLNQKLAKYAYMVLTRSLRHDDVQFLNFAYEEDPPMGLQLEASDERNRGCIQLYHATASQVDLNGKKAVEVGCGHGGGASYIKRYLGPAAYTGLDLNPSGIAFCKKRHTMPGLDFVQGDAQDLPFPDQSFDAVINVESANYYPDQARFFDEVARVLRPGGHFLYADCQPPTGVAVWEATLANAPLRKLSQRDINAETMRGMEKYSQQWLDAIDRHAPSFLRSTLRDGAPVVGSKHYQGLQAGTTTYRIYLFVKD
jgi:ubiquinone/menaquinone biosynthesis C-methylase UbiE